MDDAQRAFIRANIAAATKDMDIKKRKCVRCPQMVVVPLRTCYVCWVDYRERSEKRACDVY